MRRKLKSLTTKTPPAPSPDLSALDGLRRRAPAIVAAFMAAFLAACNAISGGGGPTAAVFNQDPSNSGQNQVDTEEHSRIVAAYGGVFHDAKVEQMLVPVVSRIVAASDRPDIAYRITILNSPAINAFALPGGYLYVTRGLLALASDSSEVAAVLAHEMGHISANHAAARQAKEREVMSVSAGSPDATDPNGQLALAAGQRTLASFSRQQELEADAIGIRTIGKAGYDPYAAARFLTAMARYADFRSSNLLRDKQPDFLATHPSTPERVAFAQQAAAQFGAPGVGDVDRERYLDGIDGMVFGDDPSQGFVRDRMFIHPGLGIGFTVPDGFIIDNTSDAVLATGVDGTALRFDAVGLAQGTDLADYLKSGWVNGLDASTVRSFSVNGLQAASAEAAAKGWFFQIAVVQAGGAATYRFIFANETKSDTFSQEATATVAGFRTMTQQELAGLKALHVHVITAAAGDTDAIIVRRMHGVDRPLDLFRALNNLQPGARIDAGTRLKIVDDR
jgi:predicted Zn-dependent protease